MFFILWHTNSFKHEKSIISFFAGTEKLTDQEALEEIKALRNEIQRLLERSPHNGAAISTISALLEAFRQPKANQLAVMPATQSLQPPKVNGIGVTKTHDKSINTDTIDWKDVTSIHRITITDEGEKRISTNSSNNTNNNNNNNNVEENDSLCTSNSNVNFDELDLKCMCSEDEEDCANYTETGCSDDDALQSNYLIKQSSDMHLESRLRKINSNNCASRCKKTYESCDNLFSSNNSSNRPKDTKSIDSCQLGFNPYYNTKHSHQKPPTKLDCDEITRKLQLHVTKSVPDSEVDPSPVAPVTDPLSPPPVPPRRSNGKPSCTTATPSATVTDHRCSDEDASTSDVVDTTDGSSSASVKKSNRNKKSPEKRLVLDLNDRSKYTEEVSV